MKGCNDTEGRSARRGGGTARAPHTPVRLYRLFFFLEKSFFQKVELKKGGKKKKGKKKKKDKKKKSVRSPFI